MWRCVGVRGVGVGWGYERCVGVRGGGEGCM